MKNLNSAVSIEREIDDESICVMDMCGRYGNVYPVNYWADYWPKKNVTYFGGLLNRVPEMPCDKRPVDSELYAWIEEHLGVDWLDLITSDEYWRDDEDD